VEHGIGRRIVAEPEHKVDGLPDRAVSHGSAFGGEAEVLVEVELSGVRLAVHLQRDCDLECGPGLHDLVRVQGHFADAVEIKYADRTSARRRRQQVRELYRVGHAATVAHSRRATRVEFASSEPNQSGQGPQRIVPRPLLTRADERRPPGPGRGPVSSLRRRFGGHPSATINRRWIRLDSDRSD
jgi:hypothetical protein